MKKTETKGFVSGIYIATNFLASLGATALMLSFTVALECSDTRSANAPVILVAGLFFAFAATVFYFLPAILRAPKAFLRYSVSTQGIKMGKAIVKYEDIKTISFARGFVTEWYGFKAYESLTGLVQHQDVFVEDMICINCEFLNFKKKGNIYIPKNAKTDKTLKDFCPAYAEAIKSYSPSARLGQDGPSLGLRIVLSIVMAFVISAIIIVLTAEGMLFWPFSVLIIISFVFFILSVGFKPEIAKVMYNILYL